MIVEKGYVTQRGSQCILSCIANYLAFRKIDISEAELFFRMKGYELKRHESGLPVYSISIFGNPEDLGVPYTIYTCTDKEEAKKSLIRLVEEEANVAILMVANKLKYNSAFKYAEDVVTHCVNVIGYDGGDKFFFSDGYIARFKGDMFEGYVPFDDFADAWGAYNFMHVATDTDKIKQEMPGHFDIDLKEASSVQTDNNKIIKEFFYDRLKALSGLLNSDELEKNVMNLNTYIRLSGMLTVKNYFKELLEDRFSQKNLADRYAEVVKEWNLVSCMLIKLAYSNDASELAEIDKYVTDAFDKEEAILTEMSKIGA